MVSPHACFQCIARHMIGTDGCLEFTLYRVALKGGDLLPVMVWLHGKWTVSDNAWGALGLHDGASLARAHLVMLAVAQYCLGIFSFLCLEGDAQSAKKQQWGQLGLGDQHVLVVWLQDNAAGLDLNKSVAMLFGHGTDGWSPCNHLLELQPTAKLDEPLFAAVIMQSGSCDGIRDVRRKTQSDELIGSILGVCDSRGNMFVAYFDAFTALDLLSLAGDLLAYCSHWTRQLSSCCDALAQTATHGLGNQVREIHVRAGSNTLACSEHHGARPHPLPEIDIASKIHNVRRTCVLRSTSTFWPWGVFCWAAFALERNKLRMHGETSGRTPVMLSRGDAAQGELELLACACQSSSVFLA